MTGVPKKSLCQKEKKICSDPIGADPIRPFPNTGGDGEARVRLDDERARDVQGVGVQDDVALARRLLVLPDHAVALVLDEVRGAVPADGDVLNVGRLLHTLLFECYC